MQRKLDESKFMAALHGVDLDKEFEKGGKKMDSAREVTQPKAEKIEGFMFKDPEDYKNMSEEEREKLTQQMTHKHMAWASNTK